MSTPYTSTFFDIKRPWSRVKDAILNYYLKPYLEKVAHLKRTIVIVDAFAGPGQYGREGSQKEAGSPVIIAEAVRDYAPPGTEIFYFNNNKKYHDRLEHVLQECNLPGVPRYGDSSELLLNFASRYAENKTVFVYQDPCGVSGLSFGTMTTLLDRPGASTEFLVNMRTSALYRMAAQRWVEVQDVELGTMELEVDSDLDIYDDLPSENELQSEEPEFIDVPDLTKTQVDCNHRTLDEIFGGDYWREYLLRADLVPTSRIDRVMRKYRNRIREHTRYAASCPIKRKPNSKPLHHLTFCSRHADALLLMNDAMHRATRSYDYGVSTRGTLFENTSWESAHRDSLSLQVAIKRVLRQSGASTRYDTMVSVAGNRFMAFLKRDMNAEIKAMVTRGEVISDRRPLNDDAILRLGQVGIF